MRAMPLARFWAQVTGFHPADDSEPDDALLESPGDGIPGILFIARPGRLRSNSGVIQPPAAGHRHAAR